MSSPDILALARAAHARGYTTAKVVARLEHVMAHNAVYLARRRARGWHTAYDDAVIEDNEVLALAIVLLESCGDRRVP